MLHSFLSAVKSIREMTGCPFTNKSVQLLECCDLHRLKPFLLWVVSIWHSHLSLLVEQMYKTHMKEVEQGSELSPRPSFLEKSNGSGQSYQLGI